MHLCSGRVFIGRALYLRAYVLSFTVGIVENGLCLPPARRTDRLCVETGGSWIGIPPRSSYRERRKRNACSRSCRDHSQRRADSVLSGAMSVGVLPSKYRRRRSFPQTLRTVWSLETVSSTFLRPPESVSLSILDMVRRILKVVFLSSRSVCRIVVYTSGN